MSDYTDPMAKHNSVMTLGELEAAHEASKTAPAGKRWQPPTRKTPARSTQVSDVAPGTARKGFNKIANTIPSVNVVPSDRKGKKGPTKGLPDMTATKAYKSPAKTR